MVYPRGVPTCLAFESLVTKAGNREHATEVAHMDCVRVGNIKKTLFQEVRGAMRNNAIALHFTETETTVA